MTWPRSTVWTGIQYAAAATLGYGAGLVPTADVVARRHAADLRNLGSGNPGAANAAAQLGARAGLQVLAGDIAKGFVAGRLGGAVAGDAGVHIGSTAAVVAHCYPVTRPGRGGKGVATSVGQVLVGFPVYFPIDAAVAIATAALPFWKARAFAATATASVVWIAATGVWVARDLPNAWGPKPSRPLIVGAVVSSAVIAERFIAAERKHRSPGSPDEGASRAQPSRIQPSRIRSSRTRSTNA